MSNYLALLNYNLTRVNASTINYSTLIGSTIIASSIISNSSINVSSIIAQTINYSTLTGSTLTAQTINYSTLRGSTMTINTLVIASTLTVSTLIATNNPAGVITSSMISLGASTNQSYTALAQGNFSTTTNWLSTLNNLSSTKFVAMSGNAQTQLAITQMNTVSSVYYTSTLGTSWSTISNVTGLPTATQTNYTCGAVSGNGQYGLLGTTSGNLYITSTLTSVVGPSFTTVNPPPTAPSIYFPFDGSIIDSRANVTATAVGTTAVPQYVTGTAGSNALYLANPSPGNLTPVAANAISIPYPVSSYPNMTISLWFNLPVSVATGSQTIFSCGNGTNIVIHVYISNSLIYVVVPTGTGTGATTIGPSPTITTNTWYNFTFTFQAGGRHIAYLNGTSFATYTNTGGYGSYTVNSIIIGAGNSGTLVYSLNGYIDEFRLYNYAIPYPFTYNNVAISNSGQYMLATIANGGLVMSSNFGSTWSQVSAALLQAMWSLLEISSTGQYMSVYAPPVMATPQFAGITGGATGTWTVNNIVWTVSASSYYNNTYFPTNAFNNAAASWIALGNLYNPVYTGNISTFILSVGTILGEYLQLQNSTPLVMNSYTFASGPSSFAQLPKNYYIVGSNDGTNWYPIQYVLGATNAGNANSQIFTTYFNVLYTGTQSISSSGATGSYATTAFPTSGNAYIYFRIIIPSIWTGGSNAEIGEWYINFTAGGQLYSTNYGAMWCNLMPANTSKLALSGSGQYALENINTTTVTTTPQLSGLTGATGTLWNVSGVAWTVTASSTNTTYWPTNAFNNASGTGWVPNTASYNTTSGLYSPTTYGTTILGVGIIYGEWLQLQTSIPLVISSYTFMSGSSPNGTIQLPKNYYIVGSNDNSSWYPIQYVVGTTNASTANNQTFPTYFNTSYTGIQTIAGGQVGSYYTTSYPTSGNAYTYFRIVITSVWPTNGGYAEIGEWLINFNNIFTQPQLTNLATSSWNANGVSWIASSSTNFLEGFPAYGAFDNATPGTTWVSGVNYTNATPAVATGVTSTTVITSSSTTVNGEWLQLQSSTPLQMYSYTFVCTAPGQFPNTYTIAGSNDGTTWYLIQSVTMNQNPNTVNFQSGTYIIANQSGAQTYTTSTSSATFTCTTSAHSRNSYRYFRIIAPTIWTSSGFGLGEWFINFSNTLTSPQLTGLSGNTTSSTPVATSWTANNSNIVWTSTASSINSATFQPWIAFNNVAPTTSAGGTYSWASAGNYNGSGAYTGLVSTTISAPYSATYAGEWIQIQSSVPVVMYNYSFASGDISNVPKTYIIAGSNDGTIWYPIQLVSMPSNPFTNFKSATYLLANYTGTQSFTVTTTTISVTTTSYSTSTNAYTYFRFITNTIFGGGYTNFEICEWFINFTTTTVSPQLSGLTGNTSSSTPVATSWAANNITWTSNASSVTNSAFQSWIAFNNISTGSAGYYAWASSPLYTLTTGVYTGSISTTISAPYSAPYRGEWLQIQSSVPVVLYNYSFACGGYANIPQVYLIAGSNDGSTWYPIQLASMASNPFGTTSFRPATSYLLANYTGSQTLTSEAVPAGATVTTTSYSTSSNAYTYFRIIANVSLTGIHFELEEWFVNFTPTQYVTSNYLSATSSTPYTAPVFSPALTSTNVPITSAASQTGQYMVLITNNTSGANVYYSTNYGANFTGLTIGTSTMVSCAISLDGSCITVMNATTVYQLNNNSIGFSVSVGNQAGQQNQYQNAIAIGNYAGQQNQTANSIVLNATGAALNSYVPGFYVSPVQQYGASTGPVNVLGYGSDNQVVQASIISLSPSGFVGIGTTNPTSLLHVNGGITTSGTIFTSSTTTASIWMQSNGSSSLYITDSSSTSSIGTTTYGRYFGIGATIYQDFYGTFNWRITTLQGAVSSNIMSLSGSVLTVFGNINLTGSVQYNGVSITTGVGSIWNAGGGGVAYYNGGNVGIGIATPNAQLQLGNSVVNRKIVLYQDGNDDHQFYGFGINGGVLRYQGASHVFYAGTSSTTSKELMNITNSGNVGIGTFTPYSQLSLHAAYINSGLFPTSSITWSTTNGTPWQLGSITGYVAAGASGSTGNLPGGLAFATKAADNSYSSSLTTRMVLDAAGFVGIGITTPLTHLYVYSNTGSGWDGRGYFGNATTGFVCGTFNNGVLIGGHNAALGAWTNITIGAATTNTSIPGSLSKGSGTFDIEHPLYPNTNKRLVHSFIEGPRCDLIYRGTVALTNGSATVYIDKQCTYTQEDAMDNGTFEALCANPDVFLQNRTGFNRVVGSIYQGILTITCENNTSTDMISWMVVAERKDPFVKQWNRTDSNGYLNTQYTKDNL